MLDRSDAAKAAIRLKGAKRVKVRGRSVSAAGVKSAWEKAKR